jgi:hypothetical protein
MNMVVFWVVAPCNLLTAFILRAMMISHRPDDGGRKHL